LGEGFGEPWVSARLSTKLLLRGSSGTPKLGVSRCAGAGGLGQGRINGLEDLGWISDLNPVLWRYDPDGGGLGETDALAESVVSLNFLGERTGGVYDEGHGQFVGLEPALGEVAEIFLGGDGGLRSKDGSAIVLGDLGRDLVLKVAGVDGSVEAPEVHLEGEVVTNEGNLVVLDGGLDHGEGAGAGGALEVFKREDSDLRSSGGLEHGSVFEGVAGVGGRGVLRVGGNQKGEEQGGCDGQSETVH
jgi:hypothetical protein